MLARASHAWLASSEANARETTAGETKTRALSHVPGADPSRRECAPPRRLASRRVDGGARDHGCTHAHRTAFTGYPARFHPLTVRALLTDHARRRRARLRSLLRLAARRWSKRSSPAPRGVGSDLNPLALELARVKALAPTPAHLTLPDELVTRAHVICAESLARVKARARTKTSGEAWDDPRMYAPHVFRELVGLRELFDEAPAMGDKLRRAVLLCFSAILIKVSRQSSETSDSVQERAIGKGLPTRLFVRKAEELAKSWRELFAACPANAKNPSVYKADARRLRHVTDASVDLIVTSPPYLGTYDYAEHHVRRLGWLGLDGGALAHNASLGARRTRRRRRRGSPRGWQAAVPRRRSGRRIRARACAQRRRLRGDRRQPRGT